MTRAHDQIRLDLAERRHAPPDRHHVLSARLAGDVADLIEDNARQRADLHRIRAQSWREAALYLAAHRSDQTRAAEMLTWYAATVIDVPPAEHRAMTG